MSLIRSTICTIIIAVASASAAYAQADVIRGRVTGPDSLPIENVTVTATSIAGNVNRTARTDKNGRFTITFPGSEGDYMISFASLGYAAKRFEVKRIADEDILIADARLQKVNAVLDAVEVRAQRERPRRNEVAPDVSGTERTVNTSEVPANLLGDLAAMAATLPGVMPVQNEDGSSGYSVLGLGSDQNNTTLNGLSFGGTNLPRDAAVSTSLITSPYDVSRGGFSGAQMSVRSRPGSNFKSRTMSMNLDSPTMQWSDAAAQSLGQEYSNASLGGLVSGPLVFDKAFYNMSYQLGRRANDFQTLLTTDAIGLKAAGVSSDSAIRLLGIMQTQQIPAYTRALRDDRVGDNGILFGTIDLTSPTATSGRAMNVTFNGGWGRQSPAGGSVTEVPGFGGDRTNWRVGAQTRHSSFVKSILSETSVGVNASKSYGIPYVRLPAGRVRVNSTFPDGTSGVQLLSFGGNPMMDMTTTSFGAALRNELSWFSVNNKHRLRLASDLRYEDQDQLLAVNTLGTFSYNSLADFESNRPASFTRQLSPRNRDTRQLVGGVSLGDSYRRAENLQITYGLRLDGSQYLTTPSRNLSLDTIFGLRNDVVPNRVSVSPRVGFSWRYGTAAQIASFMGAVRGPRAVVSGGIGLFQNVPGPGQIGSALDNTGLPNAVQQITCVGTATPIPNWNGYALDPSQIPTQCVGGSTPFANVAPNVTAFADNYNAPRSLRSNLRWSGPALNNRFATSVDLMYSLNLNQQSSVDRNFDSRQRFILANEDSRPVYVLPTSIVPSTGAIASQDARVSQRYARVTELRSDLKSETYQGSISFSPTRFSSSFSWNLFYTYTWMRSQFRGFSNTAGDPLEVDWGRSSNSPHQIGYSVGYNFFDFVRVSWNGQFRGGAKYTPMVAGDINGDGYSNDRAFIYAPASMQTLDTAIANGMQALLSNGSRSARRCLSRQLGNLAERFSCDGPWTSFANMSFTFNPLKVRMPQRASLSFQLSNPLGAADLVLHGSKNLRGWGQTVQPDPSLLYVRGFDASTPRYLYEVNRRFGATNPALTQFRTPVVLTALLRFDLAPTRERQMLTQQLDRGRRTKGQKAPEMMLRAVLSSGGLPNPLAAILRDQDTLKLTSVQADSIATLNRQYVIKLDGIWSPIVKEFATLSDDYSHDAAYGRYIAARRQTIDMLRELGPVVKGILTAEQYRRIPPFIASYLDSRYLASIRSGTAGIGAGGGPMGGFMPAGADIIAHTVGGGGGAVTIRVP